MGWLGTWKYRIKITIDSGDISATLSNFPTLVYLSASSGINSDDVSHIFDRIGINSKKIAITTNDGETQCYVEIEEWNNTSEVAWLWVKVPSISDIADTELYLYYDNDQSDNVTYIGDKGSAPAENVWDSDFLFVHHMDDPTGNLTDSTTDDRDATRVGAPTHEQTGKINNCIKFDAEGEYFTIARDDDIDDIGQGVHMIEFWFKSLGRNVDSFLISCGTSADFWWGCYIRDTDIGDGGKIFFDWDDNAAKKTLMSLAVENDNNWHHVVAIRDAGGQYRLYVDGVHQQNVAVGNNFSTATLLYFARPDVAAASYLDGHLDEIRISKSDRSTAWITATYESGRDHLIDFGVEETNPFNRFQEEGCNFRETKFGATWS